MSDENALARFHPETRAIMAGRHPARYEGAVNPPVHRASTLILAKVDDLYGERVQTYGLEGMAVHEALKEALSAIEGGAAVALAPSGLMACTLPLLALARPGGEVLVTDSVYAPTRRFCDRMLSRLGVATRYYDPCIGAGIGDLIHADTLALFMETPGSLTFELQDVPAMVNAASAHGVATIIDNTWSAGLYFQPFAHGVDFSVQALTKYQGGHADLLAGAVLARTPQLGTRIAATVRELGVGVSPDDAYLALRGIRDMHARLLLQSASALRIATWLEARPEVGRVLHPALPSHPGHALWKRDFSGASGLFGLVLAPTTQARLTSMLESLKVLSMGFSWGGYESLIIPCDPQLTRTAAPWRADGPLLRLSIGLEHTDDLIADLEQAFEHLRP